ncbi:MFS transporter [Actinoplanes sp. CA-054009]
MTIVSHRNRPAGPDADRYLLRRNRAAISALFGIAGAAIGAWTARMPTLQQHLGLHDSQLSLALLALAIGGLIGMRFTGRIIDRHGSTAVATPTALALGAALAYIAYAPNLITLAFALLIFGTVHGMLNVAMNAAALGCQTSYQRPIMSGFHAFFSIGGAAGAGAAALCAHAKWDCRITFSLVGAVLTVIAAAAIRQLVTANAAPAVGAATPTAAGPSRHRTRIAVLGVLAFACLLCEGAAADWSSVYLDRIGASPAAAAGAYAAFAASMTLGRLAGDRISAALAPTALLRGGGLLAGAGMATGILLDDPVAAIVGFGLLGAGLSCIVPQLYTAAGNLDLARPGAALSRVAAIGYLGYVLGPVIIGAAAMHVELGEALLLLPVLAVLIAVAAPIVQGRRHKPAHRGRIRPRTTIVAHTLDPTVVRIAPQLPSGSPQPLLIEIRLVLPVCAVHGESELRAAAHAST